MSTTFARFQMLFGDTAQWTANSTFVGLVGEFMVNTETGQVKVGDGVSTYAALPFVGSGLGVNFATSAEVLAGLLTNVAVAPDTLLANYPQKAVGANPQSISADWTLNANNTLAGRTTVTLQPRLDATGVNDAVPRSYIDGLFSGSTSQGATDANKAPILNASGVLDTSFIPTENLPGFRGLFNPVTGSPALQDTIGGGVTPGAINGDYFIASESGFYDFSTGTPGGGIAVNEGAQVIFNANTNQWSVVDPSGTTFDPGAVRLTPASASETTIIPGGTGVPNLTIQQIALQTADMLRFLDSGGVQLANMDTSGVFTATSVVVEATPPGPGDDLSVYSMGITTAPVLAANGWPIDGNIISIKESTTVAYQIVFEESDMYLRAFMGGSWSAFWRMASIQDPAFTGIVTAPTQPVGTDNTQVATTAFVVSAVEDPGLTQGRLSTTTSVYPGGSTTSNTLYFNNFEGNLISLYDTVRSTWITRSFSPLSTTVLGTADLPHDVFVYWTGSALALEILPWADNVNRATALAFQDGVLVIDGNPTRKYVGSYVPDTLGNINTVGSGIYDISVSDNALWKWDLYNLYNPIDHVISIKMNDGTNDSVAFTNTTWNTVFGTYPRFQLLNGQYHPINLIHSGTIQQGDARVSWNFDSPTSTPTVTPGITIGTYSNATGAASVVGRADLAMPQGLHSYGPSFLSPTGLSTLYMFQILSVLANDNLGSHCIAKIRA